jgi:hypothetical protein
MTEQPQNPDQRDLRNVTVSPIIEEERKFMGRDGLMIYFTERTNERGINSCRMYGVAFGRATLIKIVSRKNSSAYEECVDNVAYVVQRLEGLNEFPERFEFDTVDYVLTGSDDAVRNKIKKEISQFREERFRNLREECFVHEEAAQEETKEGGQSQ